MNLVIVEDSELIQTQLLRMLSLRDGIKVVGIATSEDAAVSLIASSSPGAILLDLALAPGSGIRVLERIRKNGCTARVLVVTNHKGETLLRACELLGISGFFDKNRDIQKCLDQLFSWVTPSSLDDTPQSVSTGEPQADGARPTKGYS